MDSCRQQIRAEAAAAGAEQESRAQTGVRRRLERN